MWGRKHRLHNGRQVKETGADPPETAAIQLKSECNTEDGNPVLFCLQLEVRFRFGADGAISLR